MSSHVRPDFSRSASAPAANPFAQSDTQLATQILDEPRAALHQALDIGKDVGGHTRELFVVCAPAEALRQQFERTTTPFMAVHGMGQPLAARQTLQGIAALSGWPMRRLVIRRQGFGNELAALHYIDAPVAGNRMLRLYDTEVEAGDTAVSVGLRKLLLGQAVLTAVLAQHDAIAAYMSADFAALRGLLAEGAPWPRQLAVVPAHTRTDELTQAVETLQRASGLQAEIMPATPDPSLIWALLATAWNRITKAQHGTRPEGPFTLTQVRLRRASTAEATGSESGAGVANKVQTKPQGPAQARAQAATQPVAPAAAAAPAPAAAPPRPSGPESVQPPAPTGDALEAYLARMAAHSQAACGCIFDIHTLQVAAHMGSMPAELMAKQGRTLLLALSQASQAFGEGGLVQECRAHIGPAQLVLRGIPGLGSLALLLIVKPA